MLRAAIIGTALVVSAACAAQVEDDGEPTPGPDAGSDTERERPGRPDGSPELAAPDAAVPMPCVEGNAQVSDPGTGHCYVLLDTGHNWTNAQGACASMGMHLATVADDVENELIRSLVGGRDSWLGGNDISSEGIWVWNTGEPMGYQAWRGGEPNNGNGVEDCMVVQGNQSARWDDRPCNLGYSAVCERDFD